MIEDTTALRSQLLQWSTIESLKCILVSHGSPIDDNPRQVLRELAGRWLEGSDSPAFQRDGKVVVIDGRHLW